MSVSLLDPIAAKFLSLGGGEFAAPGSDLRILVTDDDPRILSTVASFLTKAGFAVGTAATGEDALQAIAEDPDVKLLVTDYSMPEMSGAALISAAIRVRPNLRALLMTGYPDAAGLAHLPSDVPLLVKPFRRTEFLAKVECLADEIRENAQD
jgi:DNA-binding NtrC family response regulator